MASSIFTQCNKLEKLYIPSSVIKVGEEIVEYYANTVHVTIYCEATEKPEGWHEEWASSNLTIYWGSSF